MVCHPHRIALIEAAYLNAQPVGYQGSNFVDHNAYSTRSNVSYLDAASSVNYVGAGFEYQVQDTVLYGPGTETNSFSDDAFVYQGSDQTEFATPNETEVQEVSRPLSIEEVRAREKIAPPVFSPEVLDAKIDEVIDSIEIPADEVIPVYVPLLCDYSLEKTVIEKKMETLEDKRSRLHEKISKQLEEMKNVQRSTTKQDTIDAKITRF